MKNYILLEKSRAVCSSRINWLTFFHNSTNCFNFHLKRILLLPFIFFFFETISAQDLPNSDPPDLPQRGGNGNENAAPIGDGTFYLVGFGLAYIAVKIIRANKKELLKEGGKEINN
jgi:hypothetical protein